MTKARKGFFPIVIGDEVSVSQAGGMILAAMDNMKVEQGGGQILGAGNRISINQGGGWLMGAGSSIEVDQGGAGLIAARRINVERSFVGLAVGRDVSVTNSRVLLGSVGSLAAGLILGLFLGVINRLRRRS